MSRIESGKFELHPEWVCPLDVLLPCIEMVRPAMQKKHITFSYPETLAQVRDIEYFVDVLKTKRMMMNLLNNACKFTGEGGHISLSFTNLGYDEKNSTDKIIVRDNGCGMSEEFLQRIFTPFEQESNGYAGAMQGTGLGLALARQTARAMGGDITVESKLGEGSAFTIIFPYQYRKATHHAAQPLAAETYDLHGRHVLLAEDHPLNATIARKLLEKLSMIVEVVEDGKQAVDRFSSADPYYFDAILMDVRMPVMDGLQATAAIRALDRPDAMQIPIIAMTANAFARIEKPVRTSV